MKLKRLLIVLVAIVVVVCIGATTYYFLRNDEIISFEKTTLQINEGDYFTLKGQGYNGLGLTVKKPARSTEYGYKVYNMKGEDITEAGEYIVYNKESDAYTAVKGGEVVFEVTTTNGNYASYKVNVHIGDGKPSNPYYVRSAEEFTTLMAKEGGAAASYMLCNDITLTKGFNANFTGNLDGNGHAIVGLNIAGEGAVGGLFTKVSGEANVKNLTLKDVVINGSFDKVGALANEVEGSATISGVEVENISLTNTSATGLTGGLIGKTTEGVTVVLSSVKGNATITLGSEARVADTITAGGLIGVVEKSTVKGCYANVKVVANSTGSIGGLVGEFVVGEGTAEDRTSCKGTIQQSYAIVDGSASAFIGTMTAAASVTEDNSAFYKFLIGNYAEVKDNSGAALIGAYNGTNLETMINKVMAKSAAVAVKPVSVAQTDGYIYYKSTTWDTAVWNLSARPYPTLKLNGDKQIDKNSISNVPVSYIIQDKISTISQNDGNISTVISQLVSDLNNPDQPGIEVEATDPIDLTGTSYTPVDFTNRTIVGVANEDGTYPTIIINNQLFKSLNNAEVSNLNIVIKNVNTATSVYGAVANTATNGSVVSNVKVTFDTEIRSSKITTFGGVVGTAQATDINNCSATGIKIVESIITVMGGIAGSSTKSIVVAGTQVEISQFASTAVATIGGIAAVNTGNISAAATAAELDVDKNTNVVISINNIARDASTKVAGIAAQNNSGVISNIRLTGSITYGSGLAGDSMMIGGVAVENASTISRVYNELSTIGTAVVAGKNYHVAGIAITNSTENSKISECTVRGNIYGNYAYGVVEQVNHGSAYVNAVYVAGLTAANTIAGDVRVAGVVDKLTAGKVANIQTNSIVKGESNSAMVSLILLEFPAGAAFKNAAIKNQFAGWGTFYREAERTTKRDINGTTVEGYNLYGSQGNTGSMQSVVIDMEYATAGGITSYKTARFIGQISLFGATPTVTYSNTADSSYIREVRSDEYSTTPMFSGTFNLVADKSNTDSPSTFGGASYTKTLTFLTASVWNDSNTAWANNAWVESNGAVSCGVKLAFLGE